MQAVFMVGEQRSGSNLLRLMLDASGEVAAPHPPHILQRMMPLLPHYGDLSDETRFARLIHDVCRLVELNPVPWDGVVPLDRAAVRARCREHSLVAVFGAVMDLYAEARGARAWLCKSMQNVRWADTLDAYFDDARFIYLHRDPRDVTLSFMNAVIGDKHPYFIARQWVELQRLCLDARERLGPDKVFTVSYEALTREPEPLLRALCDFLGIGFTPAMLEPHRTPEAARSAAASQLWANLNRPIMTGNTQKFRGRMSDQDLEIVESLAGPVMDVLGYERVRVMPGEERTWSEAEMAAFAEENARRKAERRAATDPEDLRRRRHQERLLEEIRARTAA